MSREIPIYEFQIPFKIKFLSNIIPIDFDLKFKFDREFILKMMQKFSEHIRENT